MNKELLKRLSVLFIITLLLSSCGPSYNMVYPLYSHTMLKGGYWGDWKKAETDYESGSYFHSYRVQTSYTKQFLEILIYKRNNHPSDFAAKITINKSTGKVHNRDWFTYQGTIISKEIPVYLGTNWSYLSDLNREDYKTLECEIRCDRTMQKAIQKNGLVGTINVFYGGGLGDAFLFY